MIIGFENPKSNSYNGPTALVEDIKITACFCHSNSTLPCPLQIQRQQPLQNLLIGQVARPAIGCKNGFIQLLVRQFQPGGMGVVQIRERAFFLLGLAETFGIKPPVSLLDQFLCGLGNGSYARIIYRLCARSPWEGEGFKGRRGSVTRSILKGRTLF